MVYKEYGDYLFDNEIREAVFQLPKMGLNEKHMEFQLKMEKIEEASELKYKNSVTKFEEEIKGMRKSLEEEEAKNKSISESLDKANEELKQKVEEKDALVIEKTTLTTEKTTLTTEKAAWATEKVTMTAENTKISQEKDVLVTEKKALEDQLKALQDTTSNTQASDAEG
mmetsp:Transcript_18308/g.16186  ORF Transcript_18308/g.16186 Transcript_18308/m.16186 type:complete len:169 (+) Transcript_18308:423-929(+)